MFTTSLKTDVPKTIKVWGSLDYDRRDEGLGVRRLPAWTRPQVPPGLDVMLRMASGVRLIFTTNSEVIGLDASTTVIGASRETARPVVFDLRIGDEIVHREVQATNVILPDPNSPGQFSVARGEVKTVWFNELGNHTKNVEIWLPHNAYVTLQQIHLEADLRAPPADQRLRWTHYGSSISHCMEAESPTQTWPAVAALDSELCLTSLGFGGQCHLDQFVARTIANIEADLITIKVGINIVNMDSMRERVFVPAVHGFLDTIREKQPKTPVCLISPIFCPSAEDRPGPTIPNASGKFETIEGFQNLRQGSMSLKRIRGLLEDLVETRRASSDEPIEYFDGLRLFSEREAHLLPDDLHPNNAGYRLMGQRFSTEFLRPNIEKHWISRDSR